MKLRNASSALLANVGTEYASLLACAEYSRQEGRINIGWTKTIWPVNCIDCTMADVHSDEVRSYNMSRIRSKNTKPELLVRRFLFSQGFRFRLHQATLPGRPDIVLKKFNSIVLVNGCFWHGHNNCKYFNMPKSREEYWIPKIRNNSSKDNEVVNKLRKLGWNVFTIWECQLKGNKAEKTLITLINKIRSSSLSF